MAEHAEVDEEEGQVEIGQGEEADQFGALLVGVEEAGEASGQDETKG